MITKNIIWGYSTKYVFKGRGGREWSVVLGTIVNIKAWWLNHTLLLLHRGQERFFAILL
jgi:hypothetical protein